MVGSPPSLTCEDSRSFGAFEIRELVVEPCTDITHLVLDVSRRSPSCATMSSAT